MVIICLVKYETEKGTERDFRLGRHVNKVTAPGNVRSYTHEFSSARLPEHNIKNYDSDRHANVGGERLWRGFNGEVLISWVNVINLNK